MHKLTVFFSLMIVGLAGALGVTVWQLLVSPNAVQALGSVAGFKLGVANEETNGAGVNLEAGSAVLWDINESRLRFEKNAFERRSIASLTKIMTAMVAIDNNISWDKEMTIDRSEYGLGGNLILQPGEFVTMRDLFYASLIGSANNATLALVRGMDMPEEEFVIEMNRKAVALGLEQTTFVDVTGLDPDNIATAYDVARLAETAFTQYPAIVEATSQVEYNFVIGGSGREHIIRNTNKLVSRDKEETTGTKTGYLDEARWCLVMKGKGELANRIAVILGHPNEQRYFTEVRKVLELPMP